MKASRFFLLWSLLFSAAIGLSAPLPASLADIRALTAQKASLKKSVKIRGVITYVDAPLGLLFLADDSGSAFVSLPMERGPLLAPGMEVEIDGRTDKGLFKPILIADRVQVIGTRPLPPVVSRKIEQLMDGELDSRRVQTSGTIRTVIFEPRHVVLELTNGPSVITVRGPADLEALTLPVPGTFVTVSGVAGAVLTENGKYLGPQLLLADWKMCQAEAGANRLEDVPISPVSSLGTAAPARIIRLRGILSQTNGNELMLEDVSGRTRLTGQRPTSPHLWVDLWGVWTTNEFRALAQRNIGTSAEALGFLRQLQNGVRAPNLVRLARQADEIILDVAAPNGRVFHVRIADPGEAGLPSLVDSEIRLRGVCGSLFNKNRQLLGVQFFVPNPALITKVTAAPDPDTLPVETVGSLLRFRLNPHEHRVRVQGTVTLEHETHRIFIDDGTGGLLVLGDDLPMLKAGELVDAIGFPVAGDYTPILENARVRSLGQGRAVLPEAISPEQALQGSADKRIFDARLVTLEGILVDQFTTPTDFVYVIQAGSHILNAHLERARAAIARTRPEKGSLLKITGVCSVRVDHERKPSSFQLLLRSSDDLIVTSRPVAWTGQRILFALGGLSSLTLLTLFWIALLRRSVRKQTTTIRRQIEREAHLETRYQQLFENAHDIIYSHDMDGNLNSLNKSGEKILGYSREEFSSLNLSELVASAAPAAEAPSLPQSANQEVRVRGKNGREIVLEVSNWLVERNGHGPVVQAIARDITHRKTAETYSAAFSSLGYKLSAAASVREAARVTMDTAQKLLGWDACAIELCAENGQTEPTLNLDTIQGRITEVEPARPAPQPTPFTRSILQNGSRLILRDPDLRPSDGLMPFGDHDRLSASLIFVPIHNGQRTIGLMTIQSYRHYAYTREDVATLQALADHCAGALERIHSRDELVAAYAALEERVQSRTAELSKTNELLSYEIAHGAKINADLTAERQLLDALMDNVPDPIYFKDRDSRFLRINKAGLDRIGFEHTSEALGKTDFDIFSTDHAAQALADERRILATGRPVVAKEEREIFRDGREGWVLTTKMPLRDSNGELIGTFGISRDISERKRFEQELKRQREEYHSILDAVPALVIYKDTRNSIVRVNKFAAQFFGTTVTELEGRNDYDLHPAQAEAYYRDDLEVIQSGRPKLGIVEPLTTLTGETRWVQTDKFPYLNLKGEIIGVIVFAIDITQRRKAEEKLLQFHSDLERRVEERTRELSVANAMLKQEVSERRRAEEEKQKLAAVVENTTDFVGLATLDGRPLFVNSAGRKMMGLTAADAPAASNVAAFHSVTPLEQLRENVLPALAEKGRWEGEAECQNVHTGEPMTVAINAFIVRDQKDDTPICMAAVGRNITERKKIDKALRDSEQRYRLLFANNPHPMWVYDVATLAFVDVNNAAIHHYGYCREEFLSLTIRDLCPKEDVELLEEQPESAAVRPQSLSGISRHRLKDGSIIHCEIASHPLLLSEKPTRLVLANDVTERWKTEEALRLSEERFSKAFRASPVPIDLTSYPDGRYLDVNDSFVNMIGYTREELVGKTAMELNIWVDASEPGRLSSLLEQQRSVRDIEIRLRTKSGGIRNVLASVEFVELDRKPCLLFIVYDVTERLNLETQLRQSQKMQAVGQLAAGVAHDFNNILTIIQGHAGLVLSSKLEKHDQESVSQIAVAAERAANLTRQLLTFSRKQLMQPREIGLNEVVANAAKMLTRLLGENVSLHFNYAPALPSLLADTGMIEQIILNLAVNARDAMPAGGKLMIATTAVQIGEAHLQKNAQAKQGFFVCLSVSDTGCGMNDHVLAHLFEPFFTTKEVGRGTGLGLATVYGIVQQHRGWIEVNSTVSQGSEFHIYFPASDAAPVAKIEPPKPMAVRGGNETILVVEDEAPVRELLKTILTRYGYTVLEAAHAKEALRIWQESSAAIDLLVTDLMMPEGISGWDLAQDLLSLRSALKVIFTSGYSVDLFEHSREFKDGVNFVAKPYHPSTLAKVIRQRLDQN